MPVAQSDEAAPDEATPGTASAADLMNQANRAYDRGDVERARGLALQVLADDPDNVRMLRLVVSSACIAGDADEARAFYAQLTGASDRAQMETRCARFGVELGGR